MNLSLRIPEPLWVELTDALFTDDGHENTAALLCGESHGDEGVRLLAKEIIRADFNDYRKRLAYHLEISPGFYNKIVDRAVRRKLSVVIAHSHPFSGSARFSASDDHGDLRLLPVLQSLLPSQVVGSLVLTKTDASCRTVMDDELRYFTSVSRIGPSIQVYRYSESEAVEDDTFDRQVLAFGPAGQKRLSDLRVAVIGAGGTGSIVAELIARLGVSRISIFDPDFVETSNLNRVFGTSKSDVGKPKVAVLARHLAHLGVQIHPHQQFGHTQASLMTMRDLDLVFCCVDNDLARSILNRFAHQYLIPVVDMGVRIDARNEIVRAASGRVSDVGAGSVCLRCSHHLNPERIRAESLPAEERRELAKEGYVMGIDEPAPAVAPLNATIASLAVTLAANKFVKMTTSKNWASQIYDASSGLLFAVEPIHDSSCDICSSTGTFSDGDKYSVSAY